MSISESYNIDCMDYMKNIPDGYFDIAIPDIPYGIAVNKMAFLRETKKTVKQRNGKKTFPRNNKRKMYLGEWDIKTPDQSYFDELKRVSKHQIIFGIEYVDWDGIGPGRIKWDKCVPKSVSFKGYEYAYCSLINDKMTIKLLWSGMNQAKGVINSTVQQGNKQLNEIRIHPTQKPVLLYQKLFLEFVKPGMKIFDSHSGSQSSRIAAFEMDFDWYGCEKDAIHYSDAEKRFLRHRRQLKLW